MVDQAKGIARIPIEEAMRIVTARGNHAYDPPEPSRPRQAPPIKLEGAVRSALDPGPGTVAGRSASRIDRSTGRDRSHGRRPLERGCRPHSCSKTSVDSNDSLGDAIAGRPTLLLPADFTCSQFGDRRCRSRQARSARPDFKPAATTVSWWSVSTQRTASKTPGDLPLTRSAGPASRCSPATARLSISRMAAIGYRFQLDSANNAIAHPAAYVTLAADGRVSRVLSSLALNPRICGWRCWKPGAARSKVLPAGSRCSATDLMLSTAFTPARSQRCFRSAASLTVAILASALGLMLRRTAKRGASA